MFKGIPPFRFMARIFSSAAVLYRYTCHYTHIKGGIYRVNVMAESDHK